MDNSFYKPPDYEPSEAWKKHHEKYKLVEPAKEPNGEYYWEKMIKEKEDEERADSEWKDYVRYSNRYNHHYDDDESIMNCIMSGNGDSMGY